MKNNGFTLIELLAVMSIISIIILIAVPAVINIIESSKMSTVKISAQNYLRSVEISLKNNALSDSNVNVSDGVYLINEEGNICVGTLIYNSCNGEILEIDMNGKAPTGGVVEIKDEEVEYYELDISGMTLYKVEPTGKECFETEENEDGTLTISRFVCAPKIYDFTQNKSITNTNKINDIVDVIIPFRIDGKLVTNIGDSTFKQNSILSVTIPSSIINIENNAFYNNSLTNITIPGSVISIGTYAFYNNKLTDVIILEGVKSIGVSAFRNNSISSLSLPSTLTNILSYAFMSNALPQESAYIYKRNGDGSIDYSTIIGYGGELKDIEIPGEKNGVKLTTIANNAFKLNGLTSVKIPNGVINIEEDAFRSNNLTSVVVPNGVTIIGKSAFRDNSIKSLSLPKTLTTVWFNSFMNNKLPQESAYIYKRNGDGSIDYSTIIGYGGELKDIEIPGEKNGVKLTTIANNAFKLNGLTSVIIPEGVISIEVYAFWNNKLTSVEIPSTVTNIVGQAFYGNPLTSVTIKNSKENVTIGNQAFGTFDVNNIVWNYVEE